MNVLTSDVKFDFILHQLFENLKILPSSWKNLEDSKNTIRSVIQQTYLKFLSYQSIDYQKNEDFKKILFKSIEDIVMAYLHEQIFSLICGQFEKEDELVYKKCSELWAMQVTADQLGALEDYSIPLPAAVVELASLDIHSTPSEKFTCLSTAFDLVLAELKGAIVDVISLTADNDIPALNVADITPILATVIIHARPLHLVSNMYYMENFQWSSNTSTDCESMLAFETAVDKLKVLTVEMLRPRSSRILCDIGLEEVLKISCDVDEKFDNNGLRISQPKNPLERHIEHFTSKIAAATLNNVQK